MNQKEQAVAEYVSPILKEMDLFLVEVEYKKEGPDFYLRIFIDKNGGVTLDDCAHASEKISEQLDALDLISGPYFLDVSSPGAERPIKTEDDLKATLNQGIYVKTYKHYDKDKEWTGILTAYDDSTVTIQYRVKTREKTITIDRDTIATIRKAVLL